MKLCLNNIDIFYIQEFKGFYLYSKILTYF